MLRENVDSLDAVVRASMDLDTLRTLVQNREKYYDETHEPLTEWLLEGSIILNSVGYFNLFSPSESKPFPGVLKMSPNISGIRKLGGDKCAIPGSDCFCPYCGKNFTLQDVYKHNFGFNSNTFFHPGQCREFHYNFTLAEQLAKNMVLICKRRFGIIENICIQQGEFCELIKMSFTALGYKIEITLFHEHGISITYDKDGTSGIIVQSEYYYDSTLSIIDDILYHWIHTL